MTTDECSANMLAERLLAFGETPFLPGRTLHVLCDVHKTSAVAKRTLNLREDLITGCLKVALTARATGTMHQLRKAFRRVLQQLLVVLPDESSLPAKRYRQFILDTFLPDDQISSRKALGLQLLLAIAE